MIDADGYRQNVGIVIINSANNILLAKRCKQQMWQLPQGGINENEKTKEALFRELYEEVGLKNEDVKLIAKTPKWLKYDIPEQYLRKYQRPLCVGQKQVWYLLKLVADDNKIRFNTHPNQEFDACKWVDYWEPIKEVIDFKRNIYEDMLKILAPVVFGDNVTVPKSFTRPVKNQPILF